MLKFHPQVASNKKYKKPYILENFKDYPHAFFDKATEGIFSGARGIIFKSKHEMIEFKA